MGKAQNCTMKVISAYMLAVLGGKDSPSVADVKKIMTSVDVELSDEDAKGLEELVEELAGRNIEEVLEEGLKVLKGVPLGGGGAVAAAPGAAAAGGGGNAKKEESEDEDDDAGAMAGGGLFDDGGDDY